MKSELIFRVPGELESVREGVRLYLEGEGYEEFPQEVGAGRGLRFTRGSSLKGVLSVKTETWPTRLEVLVLPLSSGEVGLVMRYDVAPRWNLVGALDDAVIEAEASCLEDFLTSGRRHHVSEAVKPLRRPVLTAALVNMLLAALIVTGVGLMGSFPLHWVAIAACAVALLDGIVILSFADILVEGARRLPRLTGRIKTRLPTGEW